MSSSRTFLATLKFLTSSVLAITIWLWSIKLNPSESLFWAYALHITVLLDYTNKLLSNDNAGKKIKVMKKQIPNSSNSFLFRESYIYSKIPTDYPQNPWGFITVPIPIPYPYPWESPYPRQPCVQRKRYLQSSVPLWRESMVLTSYSLALAAWLHAAASSYSPLTVSWVQFCHVLCQWRDVVRRWRISLMIWLMTEWVVCLSRVEYS